MKACIPQPGTTLKFDSLAYGHLIFRLVYHHFVHCARVVIQAAGQRQVNSVAVQVDAHARERAKYAAQLIQAAIPRYLEQPGFQWLTCPQCGQGNIQLQKHLLQNITSLVILS